MEAPILTVVRFWHFTCPECGIGDQEFGHLAETHVLHCEVCLIEHGRHVRLRRWPADEVGTQEGTARES